MSSRFYRKSWRHVSSIFKYSVLCYGFSPFSNIKTSHFFCFMKLLRIWMIFLVVYFKPFKLKLMRVHIQITATYKVYIKYTHTIYAFSIHEVYTCIMHTNKACMKYTYKCIHEVYMKYIRSIHEVLYDKIKVECINIREHVLVLLNHALPWQWPCKYYDIIYL